MTFCQNLREREKNEGSIFWGERVSHLRSTFYLVILKHRHLITHSTLDIWDRNPAVVSRPIFCGASFSSCLLLGYTTSEIIRAAINMQDICDAFPFLILAGYTISCKMCFQPIHQCRYNSSPASPARC